MRLPKTSDGRPIIHDHDVTPLAKDLGMILGFALLKLGGKLELPPKAELKAMLEEKHGLDLKRNDDGSATLTLINQIEADPKYIN